MTKHKLDNEVEEVLKHYGISGMKWGVRRTEEQIASAEDGGSGGGDVEDDESLLDEMGDKIGDMLKSLESKMGGIKDSIKKKGFNLLSGIFGKSKVSYSKAKADPKLSKAIAKEMKKYNSASPTQRSLMKKGYKVRTESTKTKTSKSKDGKYSYSGKAYSDPKEFNAALEKYKKQGYKKVKKDKRSLAERGYTFKTEGTKVK